MKLKWILFFILEKTIFFHGIKLKQQAPWKTLSWSYLWKKTQTVSRLSVQLYQDKENWWSQKVWFMTTLWTSWVAAVETNGLFIVFASVRTAVKCRRKIRDIKVQSIQTKNWWLAYSMLESFPLGFILQIIWRKSKDELCCKHLHILLEKVLVVKENLS